MLVRLLHYGRKASGVLTIAVALAAWELGNRSGMLPRSMFPSMSSTFEALLSLMGQARFWQALGLTMLSWVIGLALAAAVGIPLGMLLGRVGFLYRSTRLLIDFLSTIPSVSVIPVVLLLFGATTQMKVVLIVYGAVWPILVQTAYGVRDTDRVLIDTARSYSLSRLRSIRYVLIPSAMPYIMTGVRIAAVIGLLLAVSSEVLGSAPGVGMEMVLAQSGGALAPTYAYVVLIGLVGVAVYLAFNELSRRLLNWHPSERGVMT
ncbi:ABC transporter permease [Arthrobacter sp. B2a2-09]|uniref:ABC transporter permease n=1 Tax=Arthrobacter sp. B2a2-09 TaxID=2952822 RepID=UPI0022CD43D9|nr:ABC transporter permease [Arthrobacter sp. B2a2-09]MCZ9880230.1 ABC transporter permease [Arthrobacter sp. B2a2-09]